MLLYEADTAVQFQYYSKSSTTKLSGNPDTESLNLFTFSPNLLKVTSDLSFQTYRLDLALRPNFNFSKIWTFKTALILRNQWDVLKHRRFGPAVQNFYDVLVLENNSRIWGIGPGMLLNPMLKLGYGFSIGTKGELSFLYSNIKYYRETSNGQTKTIRHEGMSGVSVEFGNRLNVTKTQLENRYLRSYHLYGLRWNIGYIF